MLRAIVVNRGALTELEVSVFLLDHRVLVASAADRAGIEIVAASRLDHRVRSGEKLERFRSDLAHAREHLLAADVVLDRRCDGLGREAGEPIYPGAHGQRDRVIGDADAVRDTELVEHRGEGLHRNELAHGSCPSACICAATSANERSRGRPDCWRGTAPGAYCVCVSAKRAVLA